MSDPGSPRLAAAGQPAGLGRPPAAGHPPQDDPPLDAPFLPSLQVVRGQATGRVITLGVARGRLGRSPGGEFVLPDDTVSRAHAEIAYGDNAWTIADLGSRNGTFVAGSRVERAVLEPGVRIVLGGSELVFVEGAADVPDADRLATLGRWDVLAAAPQEAKAALAARLTVRAVPRGGVVQKAGGSLDRIVFIVAGRARVTEVNEDGGERVLSRIGPGDVYGERALLPGQTETSTLVAETPVLLLDLPQAALAEVLQPRAEAAKTVYRSVRQKLTASRPGLAGLEARPDAIAPQAAREPDAVILGEDRRVRAAVTRVEALAREGKVPLIVGADGVGKRTLARHYHQAGSFAEEPYLEVSLADLDPGAIDAAVFGCEADPAVSGSMRKAGHLELLSPGTLVLIRAELLPQFVQHKLLTYLQRGWFHRAYGQESVRATTRVVLVASGSEADVLPALVPELRAELQRSLIALPPLAGRGKDIPLVAAHFLERHARRAGKPFGALGREAVDKLVSYAWPGNLTELENVIQRAVIVSSDTALIPGDLIFVPAPEKESHKLNLLRHEQVRDWLRTPWLFPTGTWITMAFVGVIALLTLYGGTRAATHPLSKAETNPGMLVTWFVWFPLMPLVVGLVGRVWCGLCPIAGFGDLVARVKRFNLAVPKAVKNLGFWCLVVTFVVVEYTEGAMELDGSGLSTGIFLIMLLAAAAVLTVVFERRAFCRYLCPLAAWLGAYASLSPLEIRGNRKVCQTQCGEHSCFKGTATVPGCPMALYPASITSNIDCLLCTNCVRSCEHRGVRLNLRPPLQELWRNPQPLLAVAVLAILVVAIMFNHQLSHVTVWKAFKATLPWSSNLRRFIVWTVVVAATLAAFFFASVLSAAASREKVHENMARYGTAFIPLAFAGHAAIMLVELFGEGISLLWLYVKTVWWWFSHGGALAIDPDTVPSFAHPALLTFIKFVTVSGGIAGTVVALVMIARQASRQDVLARALPHLLLVVFYGAAYLWLFTASTADPAPVAAMLAPPF